MTSRSFGPPPATADIAEHAPAVLDGPSPVARALAGLACGLVVGALAALLTPRPDRGARPGRVSGPNQTH